MPPINTEQIWVTISRTINLGNYESIKVEAGTSYSLLSSEQDRFEEIREISDSLFLLVKQKSKEFKRELKPKKV